MAKNKWTENYPAKNDRARNESGIQVKIFALAALMAGVFAIPALSLPTADSLATLVAERYGVSEFPKVTSIHYVFHVLHDGKAMERDWTWFPHADSVIYRGPDGGGQSIQAAYSRRNTYSMAAPNIVAIDKMYMNDQYWFLFPLHLRWDKDLKLEVAPAGEGAGKGEAYKLTAMYPTTGGYTPGDAYDIFVATDGTIKRWIFRRGNAPKPTVEAYWAAPEKKGDLNISLERPGTKPGFKVWFTGVEVHSTPS